jgi:hypothetical protein
VSAWGERPGREPADAVRERMVEPGPSRVRLPVLMTASSSLCASVLVVVSVAGLAFAQDPSAALPSLGDHTPDTMSAEPSTTAPTGFPPEVARCPNVIEFLDIFAPRAEPPGPAWTSERLRGRVVWSLDLGRGAFPKQVLVDPDRCSAIPGHGRVDQHWRTLDVAGPRGRRGGLRPRRRGGAATGAASGLGAAP